jgi:hypothetical protein
VAAWETFNANSCAWLTCVCRIAIADTRSSNHCYCACVSAILVS